MSRDPLAGFVPAVRDWFRASFAEPTLAQRKGWPPILAGRSTLLLAPTGSGKTLAAFLAGIDRLMFSPEPPKKERCRILYVQRVGLSATQRPLEEIARLLAGGEVSGRAAVWKPREVEIVDAGSRKPFELTVEVPVEDMARLGEPEEEIPSGPAAAAPTRRSIWPSIYPRLVELVRAHRSTMIFVNSRRLAERLAAAMNETAGEEIALAHHGSVAREKRQEIENRLKRGALPAIVATSSLELGIDMGAVDQVIQIEAPPSIASGMQRIGRAGRSGRYSAMRPSEGPSGSSPPAASPVARQAAQSAARLLLGFPECSGSLPARWPQVSFSPQWRRSLRLSNRRSVPRSVWP